METALDASDVIGRRCRPSPTTLTGSSRPGPPFQLRVESDALLGVAMPARRRGFGPDQPGQRGRRPRRRPPLVLVAGNEVGATWPVRSRSSAGRVDQGRPRHDRWRHGRVRRHGRGPRLDRGRRVRRERHGLEVEDGFVSIPADPAEAQNLFNDAPASRARRRDRRPLVHDEAHGDTTITTMTSDRRDSPVWPGASGAPLSDDATDGPPDGDLRVLVRGRRRRGRHRQWPGLRQARARHRTRAVTGRRPGVPGLGRSHRGEATGVTSWTSRPSAAVESPCPRRRRGARRVQQTSSRSSSRSSRFAATGESGATWTFTTIITVK